MPSMGWFRDWLVTSTKEDVQRPTHPYDCTISYTDGSKDVTHFWALDAKDALKLAGYWMPTRDLPVLEVWITLRK